MRTAHRWASLAVLWAACFFGLSCFAERVAAQEEKEDLARARATFQQAVELEQAGNCPAALPLFRQVGQLRMTPQVRFHIAHCEAQLGRLVAALGGYELALAEADSVGSGFREEVERNIERLKARVPRLVIQRGTGAETATIELDGVELGSRSIGVEVPLDPGPHSITASARGYESFEQTITLPESATETLEVVLTPLPAPEPAVTSAGSANLEASSLSKRRVIPYVVGGVGIASLVGSGVLFVLRQGTLSNLEDDCDENICPESSRGDYDRLKTYHYGSLITLGVGVAAMGSAATLLILERKPKDEQQASVTFLPRLLPTEAGASVRVRF